MPRAEVETPGESLPLIAAGLRRTLLSRVQTLGKPLPDGPWAVVARNGGEGVNNICIVKGRGISPAWLDIFLRPDIPQEEPETTNFLAAIGTDDERNFYRLNPEVFINWPKPQVETLQRVLSQDIPLPGIHLTVCYAGIDEDVVVMPGRLTNQTQPSDSASYLKKARNLLQSTNIPIVYSLSLAAKL